MPKPSEDYIASNPHGVQEGQVWRSRDPRDPEDRIVVKSVGHTHATVRRVLLAGYRREYGRPSRIRLDQFRRWERQ